jgi:hypothetical protein
MDRSVTNRTKKESRLRQGKRILGDRWPFLAKTGYFGWPYRPGPPRDIQKMGIFGWFNTRGREYAFALPIKKRIKNRRR